MIAPIPSPPASAEPQSSDRAAVLVGLGIFFSRVSGIAREVVLSSFLGTTSTAAEAFAFSLQIPKVLQNLLGEGALSASFIPVYSAVVDDDSRAAQRLAGAVFGLLAAFVASLVLLLMLAARPIVGVLAGGASDSRADLTADLVRTMAPGIGFIVLAAWCLGILNAHRDFFLSYVTPMLWNIAIVVAVFLWATRTNEESSLARAAAWGVLIGGVAQFAVQLPRVLRIAGPITPTLDRTGPELREVAKRFIPGVAGRGVVTLSTFTDIFLASFLAVGAVAVLSKAQVLYLMPISVFALSLAAADLPELSRESNDATRTSQRVRLAVDRVTLFVLFSALAFIFGGRSLVGALLERGETGSDDTIVVWLTLAVFSFGLLANALSRVFQTASFAHGDVAGPARIAFLRLLVAAVIGLALMFPADRYQVVQGTIERTADLGFSPLDQELRDTENSHRLGAVGLAAGGAIAAWLEFGLLARRLRKVTTNLGILAALRRLFLASSAAIAVLIGLTAVFGGLPPLLAAPLIIGPAGLLYLLIAYKTGNQTAGSLVQRVVGSSDDDY